MRLNTAPAKPKRKTHEGARSVALHPIEELQRNINASLLFEKSFYEDGVSNTDRILKLIADIANHPALHQECSDTLIAARRDMKIRHAPIFAAVAMCTHREFGSKAGRTLSRVIKRPDEIPEAIMMFNHMMGKPKAKLGNQLRQGLRSAFRQFDEYQLSKWQGKNNALPLATAMRILHPDPLNDEQSALWAQLLAGELKPHDTRESVLNGLSNASARKGEFERLLKDGKLGRMALLKSLRLMGEVGVSKAMIDDELRRVLKNDNVLPFRYLSAFDHAPKHAKALNDAMMASVRRLPVIEGTTWVFIDVSGSMTCTLSDRSEMQRYVAAASLAALWPGDARTICFGSTSKEIPNVGGIATVEAVNDCMRHGRLGHGTLGAEAVRKFAPQMDPEDRIVMITDEQLATSLPKGIVDRKYVINVANYENSIAYGEWVSISGFSAQMFKYISQYES